VTWTTPPLHVATVAGRTIPLAWLESRLAELRRGRLGRQLPPGDGDATLAFRRWIVQELVTQAVLAHEARQAGLLAERDEGHLAEAGLSGSPPALPNDIVEGLFERVTRDVQVSEAAERTYYERNPDLFRRPESRQVQYAIADDGGRSRAGLERLLTEGPAGSAGPDGHSRGGRMWLRRGQLVGPLEDAVFAADVGATVGPFELEQGWTTARIIAIEPETRMPFEEARMSIREDLLRTARAQAFHAWIASRRAVLAVIDPTYEHPGHPVHGLPQHRH
jgi:[acyl-carrier-protein] S-malonyltransferase